MTSQENQVQAIIQEIDTLLGQASPRLPWVASHETSQQRQLLERTRHYLVELQRSQRPTVAQLNAASSQSGLTDVPAETAQQVLQAVLQEVEYLRTNVMQPLRSQIDDLQRQRQRLQGEVEQIAPSAISGSAATTAGAIPPARSASEQSIAEFLEALIGQMQQSLSEQIQQAVSQIQPQLTAAPAPLLAASSTDTPALSPEQRLVKLQQLQQRIDQLMQELDVTLTTLSSSLQQNVESYQTSLAEGLDTMQSLGTSGEPLINVLVSHLAQQLGRETSAYLQSALPWQPTDTNVDDSDDLDDLDAIALPLVSDMPTVESLAADSSEPLVDLDVSINSLDAIGGIDGIDAIANPDAASLADSPIIPLKSTAGAGGNTPGSDLDEAIVIAESVRNRALEFLNSLQSNDLQFDALTHQSLVMPVPPEPGTVEGTPEGTPNEAAPSANLDLASLDLELPSLDDVSPIDASDEADTPTLDGLDEADAIAPANLAAIEPVAETEIESSDQLEQPESFAEIDTAPQIQQALGEFYASLLGQNNAPDLEEAVSATQYEAIETLLNQVDLDTDLEQAIDDALQQAELLALEYAQQADVPPPTTAADTAPSPSADDVNPIEPAEQTQLDSGNRLDQAGAPVPEPLVADQSDQSAALDSASGEQADPIQPSQIALEDEPVADPVVNPVGDSVGDPVVEQSAASTAESDTAKSDAIFDWGDTGDTFAVEATAEAAPVSEETIAAIVGEQFETAPVEDGSDRDEGSADADAADDTLGILLSDLPLPSPAPEPLTPPAAAFTLEDLLAEPTPQPTVQSPDFILDDDTLQQLNADLSQLEGVENLNDVDPDAASLADFSTDFEPNEAAQSATGSTNLVRSSDTEADAFDDSSNGEPEAEDTLTEFTADFDDSPFSESSSTSASFASDSMPNPGNDITLDRFWADFPTSSADTPTQFEDEPTRLEDFAADLDGLDNTVATPPAPTRSVQEPTDLTESTESMEAVIDRLFFNLNQPEPEPESLENSDSTPDSMDTTDGVTLDGVTLDEFGQAIGSRADAMDSADPAATDLGQFFAPMASVGDGEAPPDSQDSKQEESLTNQVLDRLFQENTPPKSGTDTQTLTIDGAFGAFIIPDLPSAAPTPVGQTDSSEQPAEPVEAALTDDTTKPTDQPIDQPIEAVEDDPTDLFNGLGMEQTGHHGLDELDQHESSSESLGNVDPLDWQNSHNEIASDPAPDRTSAPSFAPLEDTTKPTEGLKIDLPMADDVEPPFDSFDSLLDLTQADSGSPATLETFDFGADTGGADEIGLDATSEIAPEVEPVPPIETADSEVDEPTIALLTLDEPELEPSPPKPLTLDAQAQEQDWYLGLDIGATGISAVLLNRQTQTQHPLFWTTTEVQPSEQPQRCFRLPCTVQYIAPSHQGDNHPDLQPIGLSSDTVGASTQSAIAVTAQAESASSAQSAVKLHRLKPFLKHGVPYLSPAEPEAGDTVMTLEPSVRWSEAQTLPLAHMQQGLQVLLETLTIQSAEAPLCCAAVDLSQHTLYTALRVLSGVVVSYPTNWPDTYSFNIREAILGAQLVEDPAEIFFVDNAIAALLSALPRPDASHPVDLDIIQAHPQTVRSGNTLVLSAGALTSEFALVELSDPLSELKFDDFDLRSITYGGDALDQDIVCYLLYPQTMQHIQPEQPLLPAPGHAGQASSSAERSVTGEAELTTLTSDWDFQLTYDGDLVSAWQSLGLDQLALPRQGEPDLQHREQLRQRLQSSRLGQSLLQAAQHLKILLQQQAQMTIAINDIRWVIERQDFERQILLPYVQLLNRHLNTLFSKSGIATEGIRQAICTGGTASFPAIARWLRQKLPNATVIQDTYAANRPPSCSRVAYGLVNLVYYPQALDVARQQYNDYFLLLEILRSFPRQPLTIHQMMQQLERFGINTQACYFHIMALLEGHLPPGLVPATSAPSPLYTQTAAQQRHQALLVQPLFHKGKGQQYIPNPAQRERLQQYLNLLLAEKHQTLTEPLITQLLLD